MKPRDPESVYRGKPTKDLPLFTSSLPIGDQTASELTEAPLTPPKAMTSPAIQAHARKTDPATSFAAAASVRGITETQKSIIAVLYNYGEMADERLVIEYSRLSKDYPRVYPKASPSGIRSRRAELVRIGLVCDSGKTAQISTGRRATVWRLR